MLQIRPIATSANAAISRKIPLMPMRSNSNGPSTKEPAKVSAMLMPIIAIARVRTESRVVSATIATTTLEIAPAPCNARAAAKP